jgi:hypothetical protein
MQDKRKEIAFFDSHAASDEVSRVLRPDGRVIAFDPVMKRFRPFLLTSGEKL